MIAHLDEPVSGRTDCEAETWIGVTAQRKGRRSIDRAIRRRVSAEKQLGVASVHLGESTF